MKVLIIGGSGVISTEIAKECLRLGHILYVLNRGHYIVESNASANQYNIVCDIRNAQDVTSKIAGLSFDVVIDCLSYNPKQLKSTYDIFSSKCLQYIFISSCCSYRRNDSDGIITESSYQPNEILPYGKNKYLCEQELLKMAKTSKCHYTIVRPYITYGDTRIPFGIAPAARYHWTIIGRILSGKPMFVWDKENKCSLLHAEDFAKIFVGLFLNEKAFNQDVNLTNNVSMTWREMLYTLYEVLNTSPNIVTIPVDYMVEHLPAYSNSLLGDRSLNAVFDTHKICDIVPYANTILNNCISLKTGIKRTISNYRDKNFLEGIDYVYDGQVDRMLYGFLSNDKEKKRIIRFVDYIDQGRKIDQLIYMRNRFLSYGTNQFFNKIKSRL